MFKNSYLIISLFRCLKLPIILGTPYLEDAIFRRGRRFRIGKEGFEG